MQPSTDEQSDCMKRLLRRKNCTNFVFVRSELDWDTLICARPLAVQDFFANANIDDFHFSAEWSLLPYSVLCSCYTILSYMANWITAFWKKKKKCWSQPNMMQPTQI